MEKFNLQPKVNTKESVNNLEKIREGFKKLNFDHVELVELFNKKYERENKPTTLLDKFDQGSGEVIPLRDEDGKLIIKDSADFTDSDKLSNMKTLVDKFKTNIVDYVLKLSKEKELLEMASQKLSLQNSIRDISGKTLKELVEEEIGK